MAFTPILYGSKLNAPKKAAPGKPLVTGKGTGTGARGGSASLADLIAQQALLTQRANDGAGTGMTRLLARRQLAAVNGQINQLSAASGKPGTKVRQPFDEDSTRPGIQAMPTVTPGAAPDASTLVALPTVTTTTTEEDDATKLKLAEEQRQRDIESAKTAELARQDEIRKRRGYGISSFLTSGLRGLPQATSLANLLGV